MNRWRLYLWRWDDSYTNWLLRCALKKRIETMSLMYIIPTMRKEINNHYRHVVPSCDQRVHAIEKQTAINHWTKLTLTHRLNPTACDSPIPWDTRGSSLTISSNISMPISHGDLLSMRSRTYLTHSSLERQSHIPSHPNTINSSPGLKVVLHCAHTQEC